MAPLPGAPPLPLPRPLPLPHPGAEGHVVKPELLSMSFLGRRFRPNPHLSEHAYNIHVILEVNTCTTKSKFQF